MLPFLETFLGITWLRARYLYFQEAKFVALFKDHFNILEPREVVLAIQLLSCKDSSSMCHRTSHVVEDKLGNEFTGFSEYNETLVGMPG